MSSKSKEILLYSLLMIGVFVFAAIHITSIGMTGNSGLAGPMFIFIDIILATIVLLSIGVKLTNKYMGNRTKNKLILLGFFMMVTYFVFGLVSFYRK